MSTLISYPDRTLAATLTGADFSNLDNLKNPLLSKVTRTANVTGTKTINIDLGAERAIQVLSLCAHNLTAAAAIRTRGYSDSGYTSLVSGADTSGTAIGANVAVNGTFASDTSWIKGTGWGISGGLGSYNGNTQFATLRQSDVLVVGKTYSVTYTVSGYVSGSVCCQLGFSSLFTYRSANGTYTEIIQCSGSTDILFINGSTGSSQYSIDNVTVCEYGFSSAWPSGFTAQNVTDYPKNWTYCFSSPKTARYWKIEIVDTANPAGYIEIGRCWLGESAFAPALGISYGLSLGYESRDVITESLGGVPWGEKRTPRRSLVATFNTLTAAEKREAIIMQKVLTETSEAFFVTDTGATAEDMLLEAFPCFLSKPSPIQYPYFNNNVMPIQVVERV